MKKITLLMFTLCVLSVIPINAQSSFSKPSISIEKKNKKARIAERITNDSQYKESETEIILSQTSGTLGQDGVSCNDNGDTSGDNLYARVYNLSTESFTDYVKLVGIEFNVGRSDGPNNLESKENVKVLCVNAERALITIGCRINGATSASLVTHGLRCVAVP